MFLYCTPVNGFSNRLYTILSTLRIAKKHAIPFLLGWKVNMDTPFFLGDYIHTNFPLIEIEDFANNTCIVERVYGRAILSIEKEIKNGPVMITGADGTSWLHFIFAREDIENFDKEKQLLLTEELRTTFYENFRPNKTVSLILEAVRLAINLNSRKRTIGIHVRRNTGADSSDWSKPNLTLIAKYATEVALHRSCDCAVIVSTEENATEFIKSSLASVGVKTVVPTEVYGIKEEGLNTVIDFLILCELDELLRRAESTFAALPQLLGNMTAVVYSANSECLELSSPYVLTGAAL